MKSLEEIQHQINVKAKAQGLPKVSDAILSDVLYVPHNVLIPLAEANCVFSDMMDLVIYIEQLRSASPDEYIRGVFVLALERLRIADEAVDDTNRALRKLLSNLEAELTDIMTARGETMELLDDDPDPDFD